MLSKQVYSLSLALSASVYAQSSCSASVSAKVPAPSVAPGYEVRVVATNLTKPRGITFDRDGHLLVVEQRSKLTALSLEDAGGCCLSEKSRQTVVDDNTLNHAVILSLDGRTLYASSAEAVFAYPYDASNAKATTPGTILVNNMTNSDHTTRTLLLSKKEEGMLMVTRGSTSNIDPDAAVISTGHSQIKAFNLNNMTDKPYDFNADGKLLGWGLRNEVGIDEEPIQGGLYSVENSADNINRTGVDVHQNNPAEEMNFLGWLQPPDGIAQSENQGSNFGYPQCFTAWNPAELPNFDGEVGTQFAVNDLNSTNSDSICKDNYTPPALAFQAHMAPLDIKFNSKGTTAWITMHGSWDRSDPSGYKVGAVQFKDGKPVEPSTSNTALIDIVTNPDNSKCPSQCFRPVGFAWDTQGRLFFSSDATGEIYVVTKAGATGAGAGVDDTTPGSEVPYSPQARSEGPRLSRSSKFARNLVN